MELGFDVRMTTSRPLPCERQTRSVSAIEGVNHQMCEIIPRKRPKPSSLKSSRSPKASPPLALGPMLGLTGMRRQATPYCENCDFSLSAPNSYNTSGPWAHVPGDANL